jgi:hypothetical protein
MFVHAEQVFYRGGYEKGIVTLISGFMSGVPTAILAGPSENAIFLSAYYNLVFWSSRNLG